MNERDSRAGSTLGSTLRARAVAMASEFAQNSARDIAYVVFRRKYTIISIFALVVLATLAYLLITPYSYQSSTQLLIRPGRENIAMDTAMLEERSSAGAQNMENVVNAAVSILKSPALSQNVADALGADSLSEEVKEEEDSLVARAKGVVRFGLGLPNRLIAALKPVEIAESPDSARAKAASKIRNGLDVQPERRTNIVNITFTADDPDKAQKILDKVVELFLARHIEVHSPKTSIPFFEDRLRALEEVVREKQQKRDDYFAQHGIATLATQKDSMLQQINTAEVTRSTNASEVAASQARITALEEALSGRSETIVSSETAGLQNPIAEKLKATLADLRLQESDMSSRYADGYRPLIELRQQIAQAEEMLAAEQESAKTVTTAPDPGYQQLKLELDMERAQLESLRVRESMLAADVNAWREKLAMLTSQEGDVARLTRELEVAEREFATYQDGFLRAKTALELDMDKVSNVSVVQPATYSALPAAPNVLRIFALGLFLAVFGGVFAAFALEYVDSRVYTKEDIERNVPTTVLAVITDKEFAKMPAKPDVKALFPAEEGAEADSRQLVVFNGALSAASNSVGEKLYSLNRRITVLMEHSTAGMALLFTGTQPSRDSSKLVREYAAMLANQGRRVLLLSLGPVPYPPVKDKMPTDQEWAAIMNDGMVLDGTMHQVGNSTLFYTQIGQSKGSLQALATSPKFDPLIWKIKSTFDIVLVDCPPVTESALGPRLSQLVDGAIMVADAGSTRWQVIHSSMREFQANQGRVFGVILNKRKYYIPSLIYRFF